MRCGVIVQAITPPLQCTRHTLAADCTLLACLIRRWTWSQACTCWRSVCIRVTGRELMDVLDA